MRRRADTVLTPEAPTFCLRPSFANIHSFNALSDCAVLDLLMPPYADGARDCHYFALEEHGEEALLVRVEPPPASMVIRGQEYRGDRARVIPKPVEQQPVL